MQGDPLSPTLYDVFIDPMLRETEGLSTIALMFADDFSGAQGEPPGMQNMLDHLGGYTRRWRIQANLSKSAVMVVEGKPRRRHPPQGGTISSSVERDDDEGDAPADATQDAVDRMHTC